MNFKTQDKATVLSWYLLGLLQSTSINWGNDYSSKLCSVQPQRKESSRLSHEKNQKPKNQNQNQTKTRATKTTATEKKGKR